MKKYNTFFAVLINILTFNVVAAQSDFCNILGGHMKAACFDRYNVKGAEM
jgi:hypothetical protein